MGNPALPPNVEIASGMAAEERVLAARILSYAYQTYSDDFGELSTAASENKTDKIKFSIGGDTSRFEPWTNTVHISLSQSAQSYFYNDTDKLYTRVELMQIVVHGLCQAYKEQKYRAGLIEAGKEMDRMLFSDKTAISEDRRRELFSQYEPVGKLAGQSDNDYYCELARTFLSQPRGSELSYPPAEFDSIIQRDADIVSLFNGSLAGRDKEVTEAVDKIINDPLKVRGNYENCYLEEDPYIPPRLISEHDGSAQEFHATLEDQLKDIIIGIKESSKEGDLEEFIANAEILDFFCSDEDNFTIDTKENLRDGKKPLTLDLTLDSGKIDAAMKALEAAKTMRVAAQEDGDFSTEDRKEYSELRSDFTDTVIAFFEEVDSAVPPVTSVTTNENSKPTSQR